jgi:hypothetical protein
LCGTNAQYLHRQRAYSLGGADVTNNPAFYDESSGLHTTFIDFRGGQGLAVNNLGGAAGNSADQFIELSQAVVDSAGRNISLKIFNTTEYRAPRASSSNQLINNMFSINLRPLYDEFASGSAFSSFSPTVEARAAYESLFPDLGPSAWDSRYTNMVDLWFVFTGTDGAPVELEEYARSPCCKPAIHRVPARPFYPSLTHWVALQVLHLLFRPRSGLGRRRKRVHPRNAADPRFYDAVRRRQSCSRDYLHRGKCLSDPNR